MFLFSSEGGHRDKELDGLFKVVVEELEARVDEFLCTDRGERRDPNTGTEELKHALPIRFREVGPCALRGRGELCREVDAADDDQVTVCASVWLRGREGIKGGDRKKVGFVCENKVDASKTLWFLHHFVGSERDKLFEPFAACFKVFARRASGVVAGGTVSLQTAKPGVAVSVEVAEEDNGRVLVAYLPHGSLELVEDGDVVAWGAVHRTHKERRSRGERDLDPEVLVRRGLRGAM